MSRRGWIVLAVAVGVGAIVLINHRSKADKGPRDVVMFIDGQNRTAGVDLTIRVGGSTSQVTGKATPVVNKETGVEGLHYTVPAGELVYVSAQRAAGTNGYVSCRIEVDGVVIDSAKSTGPYVIASCSGRA